MKARVGIRRILKAVQHYVVFFLLMAFIITCCTMLFVSTMRSTMGITLTEENINTAAKLTFANVVFLSLICTVIDWFRRELTVHRPTQKIVNAAQRFIQGGLQCTDPAGKG